MAETQQKPAKKPKQPADNIVLSSIESLLGNTRNSRKHDEKQILEIIRSIKDFGWTNRVLIDEEGTIIAGHARVEAAKRMGNEKIPCMVAKGWSDEMKRRYMVLDNKIPLNASWDAILLDAEIRDLASLGIVPSDLGFSEDDIQRLEEDLLSAQTNDNQPRNSSRRNRDDSNEEPEEEAVTFSLVMEQDQREAVFQAIRAAKARDNHDRGASALATICNEWLQLNLNSQAAS
jgi:ParB-like chromosome segregation protein Spo0J